MNKGSFQGIFRRLRRDRSGVGAIEFAFVAPVLIVLYIGAVEMTVAMSVNKKLSRAASTVTDLLTQGTHANWNEFAEMENVARAIVVPYAPGDMVLKITGIRVNGNGVGRVSWSWESGGGKQQQAYAKDTRVDLPESFDGAENTFLVRTEISYRHDMITSFPVTGKPMTGIDMEKTYFMEQRLQQKITCCNNNKSV